MKSEKNISVFNKDVSENLGYLYTGDQIYSAKVATAKQTEELIKILNAYFPKNIKIVDIGCGDGKHTLELSKKFPNSLIVGVDPASEAIKIAREKAKKQKSIKFLVGNIYNLDKLFRKNQFDLAIIRGVLHHLYFPQKAIKKLRAIFPSVIVIEANGYNPILKMIEKLSPYHLEHEEKSYWPPALNNWFQENDYKIVTERYYGIVPYFCPKFMAKILKVVEPFFENIPLINRLYCACNYILYKHE